MLPSSLPSAPLRRLVHQLLLGRVSELDPEATLAFVRGWSSAFELMRRTDLTIPEAPPDVKSAVEEIVNAIEAARLRVLGDAD